MEQSAGLRARVDERLAALYDRYRELDRSDVARYYEPSRGYCTEEETAASHDQFAISLMAVGGESASAGDAAIPFALQSVSKVFTYALALSDHGPERVLQRVGVQPTGEGYNSIVFDERHNRPFNPMVNSGAIVTCDLIRGRTAEEKLERILESMRRFTGNPGLAVDHETFMGELRVADHNRAVAYLLRAQGMIAGDVEATLGVYLQQCSVHVTCEELAVMGATLANGGVNPRTGERCLAREHVRHLLSVMHTCGMYNYAGQWAYEVGVPAKSGVSGCILCAIPAKLGVAVFSPGLDEYGNSVRGVRVCQEISERLGLHIFATEAEDRLLGEGEAGALPAGETA